MGRSNGTFLQARQPARLFRRLPLRIVEIGGHRDHGLLDFDPQPVLGSVPQRAENLDPLEKVGILYRASVLK